jgi:enterobactin synthetase component F
VVEEYQRYRDSEAWQRDGAFWAEQRKRCLLRSRSLRAAAGARRHDRYLRLKLAADGRAFSQLAQAAGQVQRADLALALVALWLGRLTGRLDYAAGFIFMRRMGSAALTATGPVLNVLPLAVSYRPAGEPAGAGAAPGRPAEKMRRHQRYDAEQIVRDSGVRQG